MAGVGSFVVRNADPAGFANGDSAAGMMRMDVIHPAESTGARAGPDAAHGLRIDERLGRGAEAIPILLVALGDFLVQREGHVPVVNFPGIGQAIEIGREMPIGIYAGKIDDLAELQRDAGRVIIAAGGGYEIRQFQCVAHRCRKIVRRPFV